MQPFYLTGKSLYLVEDVRVHACWLYYRSYALVPAQGWRDWSDYYEKTDLVQCLVMSSIVSHV
jgi:hypothetical protein